MPAATITELFAERVQSHPERVALRYKSGGAWRDITWGDYGTLVRRAGKGMMSLGLGSGGKMSLLSRNRPEWHVADVACMSIGGATTPIYATNSTQQVRHVVADSDSKIVVVENSDQLHKVLAVRSQLPALEKVVVFEGYEGGHDDLVLSWEDLLAAGDQIEDARYAGAREQVKPDDLATLVYTSGTTGEPKGVELTHANVWFTATHIEPRIPLGEIEPARALSYLPLSHIAERMISHLLQIYYGAETWFAESVETLLRDLQECKPTYFFAVPRVWEKFHAGFFAKLDAADPKDRKVKLARKAVEVGRRVAEAEQEAVARGGTMSDARVPMALRMQHAALDKLVLHKVREAFGLEECRFALSAAAPLNPELIWFFHSIGIKVAEGYGQSEDCGPTSWNPPRAVRIGTVGPAFPGVEVRFADDGELLVRGGNVMTGYYKNERATKETIDEDGWLHSGDVGRVDENGYITITDRKKDLLITAGGKNIAPQALENRLKVNPLVSQVVVVGDRRPFIAALITLDEEKAPAWAREHGIDGDMAAIARDERTLKEIEGAVNELNASIAEVEGIKRFRILERDFEQDRDELTPTLKVKRKQIAETYAAVIEEMYERDAPVAAAAGT